MSKSSIMSINAQRFWHMNFKDVHFLCWPRNCDPCLTGETGTLLTQGNIIGPTTCWVIVMQNFPYLCGTIAFHCIAHDFFSNSIVVGLPCQFRVLIINLHSINPGSEGQTQIMYIVPIKKILSWFSLHGWISVIDRNISNYGASLINSFTIFIIEYSLTYWELKKYCLTDNFGKNELATLPHSAV